MAKRNLLLLHGALGSSSQYDRFVPELEKQFNVFRFNFEGHGDTPSPNKTFRMEYFSDNLTTFIAQNELTDLTVLGYSMGGYAALYSETVNPGPISKIITLGTKFDWSPEKAAKEIKMLDPVRIVEKIPSFADDLKNRHTATGWENVLNYTAEMMKQLGFKPLLTKDSLTTISAETVICHGKLDAMVTEEESRWAAEYLKNGRFVSIPDLRHPLESLAFEQLKGIIL